MPPSAPARLSRMFSVSSWRRMRAAAGAERGAHGDLRPAGNAARQLQIGDVGAHHQQHKQRGAQHQPVVEICVGAVDAVEQRLDVDRPTRCWLRDSLGEVFGQGLHLGLRLLIGNAIAEARSHHVVVRAAIGELIRRGRKRQVDVGRRRGIAWSLA